MSEGKSMTSSRLSKRGGQRDTVSTELFAVTHNLLSDSTVPHFCTYAGIVIETLQILSFAFAPEFRHTENVVEALAHFVAASRAPFYNQTFGDVSIWAFITMFIIGFLVIVITLCLLAGAISKVMEQHSIPHVILALLLQAIATWLAVPLAFTFMSPVLCRDGNMAFFPQESCWEGAHIALFIMGIITGVVQTVLSFVASTALCCVHNSRASGVENAPGGHVLDRAHAYAEVVHQAARPVIVLLYVVFMALQEEPVFCWFLTIIAAVVAFVHAVSLPFHNNWVTQLRVATWGTTSVISVLNAVVLGPWGTLAEYQINSMLVAAMSPAVFYIFWELALIRISPEFTHRMQRLLDTGIVAKHRARFPFPRHLLESDKQRTNPRMKTLEGDLLMEHYLGDLHEGWSQQGSISRSMSGEQKGEGADEDMKPPGEPVLPETAALWGEIVVPMLDRVILPTDAEVSARFLLKHTSMTNRPATGAQLAFTSRIYNKALLWFNRSGIVKLHFAAFLFHFAAKLNLTLELLDGIDGQASDHDFWALLASYRLGLEVKMFFGIRDLMKIESFNRAKRLHKEALCSISGFWNKLVAAPTDIVSLIHVTNTLTEQRNDANSGYQRVLQNHTNDRQLIAMYASFLGDVMLNKQLSAEYKQIAEDLAEEKRSRIMRGGARSATDSMNMSIVQEQDDDNEEEELDTTRPPVVIALIVGLCFMALCSMGLFAAQVAHVILNRKAMDAANALGHANTYLVETVHHVRRIGKTAVDSDARVAALERLAADEAKFASGLNAYAHGDYNAVLQSEVKEVLFDPKVIVQNPLEGPDASRLYGLFTIGMKARVAATNVINKAVAGAAYTLEQDYFNINVVTGFSEPMLTTGALLVHDVDVLTKIVVIVAAVCFFTALLALLFSYAAFKVNLENGGSMKTTVIKLFSLIPLATQQALEVDARRRVESFDQFDKDKDDEHDEHAKEEVMRRHSRSQSFSPVVSDEGSRSMSLFTGRAGARRDGNIKGILKRPDHHGHHGAHHGHNKDGHRHSIKKKKVTFTLPPGAKEAKAKARKLVEPTVLVKMEHEGNEDASMKSSADRRQSQVKVNAAAHNAASAATSQGVVARRIVVGLVLLGFACAGGVVAGLALGIPRSELLRDDHKREVDSVAWILTSEQDILHTLQSAKNFIVDSTQANYKVFFDFVGSANFETETVPPTDLRVHGEAVMESQLYRAAVKNTIVSTQIAMAHAAAGSETLAAGPALPEVTVLAWPTERTSEDALRHYDEVFDSPRPIYGSSTDLVTAIDEAFRNGTLAARKAEILKNVTDTALNVIASDKYSADVHEIESLASKLLTGLVATTKADVDDRTSEVWTAITVTIVTNVIFIGVLAALIFVVFDTASVMIGASPLLKGFVIAGCAFASTALIFLIALAITFSIGEKHNTDIIKSLKDLHDVAATHEATTTDADGFVLNGTGAQALKFYSHKKASVFVDTLFTHLPKGFTAPYTAAEMKTRLDWAHHLQDISVTLRGMALNYTESIPHDVLPFLTSYDVTSEATYAQDRVTYQLDTAPLQYRSLTIDKQKSSEELIEMARYTTSSPRAWAGAENLINTLRLFEKKLIDDSNADAEHNLRLGLFITAAVLNGCAVVCLMLTIGSLSLNSFRTTAVTAEATHMMSTVFVPVIRKSIIAVGLLVVLVTVQFVLVLVYQSYGKNATDAVWASNRRSAHASLSITQAERIGDLIAGNPAVLGQIARFPLGNYVGPYTAVEKEVAALEQTIVLMEEARNAVGFNGASELLSSRQREISLGVGKLEANYLQWTDNLKQLVALSKSSLGAVRAASLSNRSTITDGDVVALGTFADASSLTAMVSQLRDSFDSLLDEIEQSTTVYVSDAKAHGDKPLVPAAIILVLVLIAAFAEDRLVFSPTGEKLAAEERGAKLLLNMIPDAVRNVVPKIRLYLEAGIVVEADVENDAYGKPCEVVDTFLGMWQNGSGEQECFQLLEESSFATIVINATGVVQHINAAFTELLEYETADIVSHNVRILTEEPIRSLHDSFLSRYTSGGTSRIIGSYGRDLYAVSGSGQRRHVFVQIREAARNNGDGYFIATLKPYDLSAVSENAGATAALVAAEES